MALRRFGILVVAVVASLAVGAPPAIGTRSSDENGRIAFASDRDENFEIYSMRANGSRQVNRTQHPGGRHPA
jgi:hypothetical protein